MKGQTLEFIVTNMTLTEFMKFLKDKPASNSGPDHGWYVTEDLDNSIKYTFHDGSYFIVVISEYKEKK